MHADHGTSHFAPHGALRTPHYALGTTHYAPHPRTSHVASAPTTPQRARSRLSALVAADFVSAAAPNNVDAIR